VSRRVQPRRKGTNPKSRRRRWPPANVPASLRPASGLGHHYMPMTGRMSAPTS